MSSHSEEFEKMKVQLQEEGYKEKMLQFRLEKQWD